MMSPLCRPTRESDRLQEIKAVLLNAMLFAYIVQANTLIAKCIANAKYSLIIRSYGQLSEFGAYLNDDLSAEITTNGSSTAPMNAIIYINTQVDLGRSDLDNMRHEQAQSAIAILDGTSDSHHGSNTWSKPIGGLGFNSLVIMIKFNSEQRPEYKSLLFLSEQNLATDITLFSSNELQKMAAETYAMLSAWPKEKANRSDRESRQISGIYKPETSIISVELRHVGYYPCMVGKDYVGNSIAGVSRWTDEMIDACDGKASVSLFYIIDLLRSASSDDGSTEDAKFLRITSNPAKEGGAGWHFSDAPSHKTLWYENRANRIEWFGPIVEDYAISFVSRDPELRLHQAISRSTARYSNIVKMSSIKIKVPQAMLGAFQPAGFMTKRNITYKNYEDAITNRSSDITTATANGLWSREFDKYSGDWRTHTDSPQLWCDGHFFDDNAFSPVADAHFSPGFSVAFKASSEKNDHSNILFSGAANVVALAGGVQYKFLLQHYSSWISAFLSHRKEQNLSCLIHAGLTKSTVSTIKGCLLNKTGQHKTKQNRAYKLIKKHFTLPRKCGFGQ